MPFQVSPGVNFSEIDLTTVTPAVSSTEGAIAGVFRWGPVEERILIDTESSLVQRFGKPTNFNDETFFTASSFLAYGNKLYVVRAANTTGNTTTSAFNAVANVGSITTRSVFVAKNREDFDAKYAANTYAGDTDVLYMARYPGAIGNSLKISVCDSANAYTSTVNLYSNSLISNTSTITATVGSSTLRVALANSATGNVADAATIASAMISGLTVGDYITVGNTTIGTQYMKVQSVDASPTSNSTHAYFDITSASAYQLSSDYSAGSYTRNWEYFNAVDKAPGASFYQQSSSTGNTSAVDELHVVVSDQDGKFTGVPGTVLEVYSGLSRATDATTEDGSTNNYREVINNTSQYIWMLNDRTGATSATAASITSSTNAVPLSISFVDGSDGPDEGDVVIADILRGYDLFKSAEDVDISLVLQGKSRGGTNGEQLANYIIDNICESRRDCVAFLSPAFTDVVRVPGQELTNVLGYRNSLRSTSYAVLDSGYKYTYDKYNDVYRYVPLNGDIAGLAVYTDSTRDPWFSPAGFNRGQIKNIVKLAYNPSKADRDQLYKAGVNPVVTFPGQGTVLFGDKTLLNRPSAFDRINVRRLFIVLEKAISTASKSLLFEFNDEFTRAQFRNLVEPFLRDVQGRRGIYAYKVVCDDTNNTTEVIDRNEFVGDIYIKPAKSINFIQLNFVAVRTGVEFSEIVGQF
jgi:Phage tail sheath protein subtilisin-like domain/Phage tail sheath C-terminal domain